MIQDYIELCQTAPNEEKCMQVQEQNYLHFSRLEAKAYIELLIRTHGQNPSGTYFSIVRCPHEFGTYHDIRFTFNEESDKHIHYMTQIEKGVDHWDETASKYLIANQYPKLTKVIHLKTAS